jgi:hypothetical protein
MKIERDFPCIPNQFLVNIPLPSHPYNDVNKGRYRYEMNISESLSIEILREMYAENLCTPEDVIMEIIH